MLKYALLHEDVSGRGSITPRIH